MTFFLLTLTHTEKFLHKHSQTLAPTGRESPQTEAFGEQHGIELREQYQHVREYQHGQEHQHGNQHQFASGGAHRLPPERTNGTQSGSTDSEHLVGEATLGLQPGQELRLKIKIPSFFTQLLLRVIF